MGNSVVPVLPTSKYRSITDIMKDPAAKQQLSNLVDEAVKLKTQIATHQQTIKELREIAMKDVALSPKLFNLYVGAAFNNDYSARQTTLEESLTLIENVIGMLPEGHSSHEDE